MRRPRRNPAQRPPSHREQARQQALVKIAHEHTRLSRPQMVLNKTELLKRWGLAAWQTQWDQEVRALPRRRAATAWHTPWTQDTRMLYAGQPKAESTALFLLRSEVIGLNAWLASIQVPEITRACLCGYQAQTVRHILLHCPRYNRAELLRQSGSGRLQDILNQPSNAQRAARWFIHSGVLEQFRTAKEIAEEDRSLFRAFPEAEQWL